MDTIKLFEASSEVFSGYQLMIDITLCNSIDDIINTFIEDLRKCLVMNNFVVLLEKLNQINFHIHDYTLEDIYNTSDSIYYICDHC